MQAQRIDSLTSLRFIAAALVVIFHSRHSFGGFSFAEHFSLTQAVSMFFVLSGFILTHTHREISSGRDLGIFYISRAARIWPMHIAGALAVLAMMSYYGGSLPTATIGLNLFLLQSWVPDNNIYFSLNGIAWSLSVEAFFYAMFPLLIYRIEKNWQLKLIASVALTALMLTSFKYSGGQLMQWSSYISPLTRLSEFMLGIAAYQIYRRARETQNLKLGLSTAVEVAIVALSCGVMWAGDIKFISSLQLPVSSPTLIWFTNCGGGFVFAMLIVVFALQRGAISTALRFRPFVYLGEISFALYMVHQIVLRFMEENAASTNFLSSASVLTLYYAASLACAAICYHLIETPARRRIVKLAHRITSATRGENFQRTRG